MYRIVSSVVLICLLLTLPACLFGRSSKTEFQGRHVSTATMEQLEVGASKDDALELFGEPSNKSQTDAGDDLWSWNYTKKTTSTGAVFLLFGSSSDTTHQGTVYVRFKNGKVTRVWRTGE